MADEPKVAKPVVIKTEEYSPSIKKMIMSDNSTMYGCTWPACNFAAEAVGSVGSHFKLHSGQAAQRRRGERKPRTNKAPSELQRRLLAVLDEIHDLINEVDAWEASNKETAKKAEAYDAIKGLLE
jgi:hypothetical protein